MSNLRNYTFTQDSAALISPNGRKIISRVTGLIQPLQSCSTTDLPPSAHSQYKEHHHRPCNHADGMCIFICTRHMTTSRTLLLKKLTSVTETNRWSESLSRKGEETNTPVRIRSQLFLQDSNETQSKQITNYK